MRRLIVLFIMLSLIPPAFTADLGSMRISWAGEDGFAIRNLSNGAFVYSDRDYVFSNLPACLQHQAYLLTPNKSKFNRDDRLVRLVHEGNFVIFIGYDDRYRTRPDWLNREYDLVPYMTANVLDARSNRQIFRFQFYRSKSLVRPRTPILLGGNIAPQVHDNFAMYTAVFVPHDIECP